MLLHKLKRIGFDGKLFDWLSDCLKNRKQRVVLNRCISEWIPVTSGVSQGSILGPLLFLLFINDRPDDANNFVLALFADDAKCFRRIVNNNDCINLPVLQYLFNFNSLKRQFCFFTRNHNQGYNVCLYNWWEPLENVTSFCDLCGNVYCSLT